MYQNAIALEINDLYKFEWLALMIGVGILVTRHCIIESLALDCVYIRWYAYVYV